MLPPLLLPRCLRQRSGPISRVFAQPSEDAFSVRARQQKRNRRIIEAFALSFEDVARRAIDLAGPCSFRSSNWSNHPPVAKKPNYDFEKRRKELDRKKKKEDKRLERLQRRQDGLPEDPDAVSAEPAEEHEQADGVAE
jgi:hypothetical protein